MKFPYLTGEVGNIGISKVKKRSIGGAPWWLAGGIDPSSVAAVWQPKGAASLAASYLRLAGSQGYANIDPAIVGGVAPTWNAANGWSFGSPKYLNSGLVPADGWSAIIQYTDASSSGVAFGCAGGIYYFGIEPFDISNKVYYENGNYIGVIPKLSAGNLAFAAKKGYRNGVPEATIIGGNAPATQVYIGCRNQAGAFAFCIYKLSAIAFYIVTITDTQIAALAVAMMAL